MRTTGAKSAFKPAPHGIAMPPAQDDEWQNRCREEKLQDEVDFELATSYRILARAVDDISPNCAEISGVTDRPALGRILSVTIRNGVKEMSTGKPSSRKWGIRMGYR